MSDFFLVQHCQENLTTTVSQKKLLFIGSNWLSILYNIITVE